MKDARPWCWTRAAWYETGAGDLVAAERLARRSAGGWRWRAVMSWCTPTPASRVRGGNRGGHRRGRRDGQRGGVRCRRSGRDGGRRRAEILAGGAIEILINNAGIHEDAVMPGMRREQWARVIDVSLNGFFNVTQPLLLPMMRGRWGRIVNISSVAAQVAGNRGQTNLRRRQSRFARRDKVAFALELASRWNHGQHGGTGHHRVPHGGRGVRPRADRPAGTYETRGHAGGSRRTGAIPDVGASRLHLRPDHFDQRRDDLSSA